MCLATPIPSSFTQDHPWLNLYLTQDELLRHFRMCVDRFGIADRIRYRVEVAGAQWDDEGEPWSVDLRHADGTVETATAKAVVSAIGFLNRPNEPRFKGVENFKGEQFHSARWRHDVSLEASA
jgi:4-hydroxyacetophenone monooxygenase